MGPQFGETACISKVNKARKVKSDAQLATNNNSDPVHFYSAAALLAMQSTVILTAIPYVRHTLVLYTDK